MKPLLGMNETGASNSPGVSFIMYLFKKLLLAVYATYTGEVSSKLTQKKTAIYRFQLLRGVSYVMICVPFMFLDLRCETMLS